MLYQKQGSVSNFSKKKMQPRTQTFGLTQTQKRKSQSVQKQRPASSKPVVNPTEELLQRKVSNSREKPAAVTTADVGAYGGQTQQIYDQYISNLKKMAYTRKSQSRSRPTTAARDRSTRSQRMGVQPPVSRVQPEFVFQQNSEIPKRPAESKKSIANRTTRGGQQDRSKSGERINENKQPLISEI